MKPRLIALNLLLVAAIAAVVWQARVRLHEARVQRRATLNVPVRTVKVIPPPAAPGPEAPVATKYAEVAEKNLFSSDRNPNVVIEAPPAPPPPKPMPPLPVLFGTMGLPSGTKALMAEKAGEVSRSVKAGDTIGEFKIAALDTQTVTFEWNGKRIDRRVEDLIDRSAAPVAAARGPAVAPAAGAPPAPGQPPAAQQPNANPALGVSLTATTAACRPGDTAPPGTVVDGFKKVETQSPFGTACRWVKQ